MKTGLGEKNLTVLRDIRNKLVVSGDTAKKRNEQKERWETLGVAAQTISEAVEGQDLESLVSATRKMKNLLRRSSIRKELAQLESEDSSFKKEKPKGSCKCAQCGATIDGYRECISGALCPDCALKKRKAPPGEKEDEKAEKTAKKGTPFPPEMVGTGMGGEGMPGDSEKGGMDGNDTDTGKSDAANNTVSVTVKKGKDKKKKKKFDDEKSSPLKKKQKVESRLRRRSMNFNR